MNGLQLTILIILIYGIVKGWFNDPQTRRGIKKVLIKRKSAIQDNEEYSTIDDVLELVVILSVHSYKELLKDCAFYSRIFFMVYRYCATLYRRFTNHYHFSPFPTNGKNFDIPKINL